MEQLFSHWFKGVMCAFWALCACFGWSCGESEETAEVGFILVLADHGRSGPMNPRDILDRNYVVEATCQVFIPGTSTMIYETFAVEPVETYQEGHLYGIPPGSGYFGRILGLTGDRSVYQCGANGPFILEPGEKEFLTVIIDRPPQGDPYCENVCASNDDCMGGTICPSPCAAGDFSMPCTPALCRPG